ncbi:PH domain-containing protein [Nonlabens ulvanivorans]|uniref:PH domain-containing protein n=1 Tax=Nonlabens ulvanivorans TaxID=906888 RepID=UPI0037C59F87
MTNEQLLSHQLPVVELSNFEKHPRRFLNKKLVAKLFFFIPVLTGVIILFFMVEEYPWIWKAAGVAWFVFLILSVFISYKEFFVRGYVLREHDITYRHGWLFHHQITIPFNRIQHTEINHGPIDRYFKLCELDIYTAGGSSSDLSISGLDPDKAVAIKEYISEKTAQHA